MSLARFVSLACVALIAAGCQSMDRGVLSVEARAIVFHDTTVDDFDAATSFDEEDVDTSGYGGQVAFMTPIVDIVGGVDVREFESEDATELSLGLRRRFLEFWRVRPYVEANVRYASGLDTGVDEEDYTGWNGGVGALLDLTDHFFFNARLMYESTPLDLPAEDTDIEGVIGTIGIGFNF